MTLVHAASVGVSGKASAVPSWLLLALLGGGLLLMYAVRARRVTPVAAETWLRQRNLPCEGGAPAAVLQYLRRLRWSRVWATALLMGVCAASLLAARTAVSFLSLPFLLSVLAAEAGAPEPRRGRVRVAALGRRPRGFFAPRLPLALARLAIGVGALLSLAGALFRDDFALAAAALVHAAMLAAGLAALELCLHRTAVRALPDRQPDLAVDTAMRVASSRAVTAAALLFGTFGLVLSFSFSGAPGSLAGTGAGFAASQVVTLASLGVIAVAARLVQPLTSWQPRETS